MLRIEHLNPAGMHANPAFSQAISVAGPHKILYVGGQNAVDERGRVVGQGDVAAQAEQVARNLSVVLAAGGAKVDDVVRWRIHLVEGQPIAPAMQAFQRVLGQPSRPPAITVAYVAGLAHPDFLLEVEATAVVPDDALP